MASIPTIPGTDVSPSVTPAESPSLAVQIDATPGLKARGAMADAVTTAATVIGDYEDKKQKLQEFDIANKSYLSFTKLKQEFDKQIDTTPYDQLENKWNQMSSDWRSQQEEQYKGKLTREAQMEIGNHWDTAITGVNGQVNVIATRKQHADFMGTMNNVITEAAYSGDEKKIKNAEKVIDTGVKLGIVVQGEAEEYKYKLHVTADEAVVNNALNGSLQDKFVAKEMLKDSDKLKFIPVKQRPIYNRKLDLAIATDQRNNLNELKELRDSGDKVFTEEELLEKQNKKEIPPDSVKTFMRVQNGKVDTQAEAATVKFLRDKIYEIANNPALSDRQVEDAITDLKATPQYGSLHAPFVSDLDKTLGDIKSVKTKTEGKAHEYLNSYLNTGKLGDRDVLTNKAAPDSIKRFQQIFDLFEADYAKHPEWTYDDITKHIDGLVKKSVTGRQSKDLTSLITGQVQE